MPQRSPVRPTRLRASVLVALVTLLTAAGHVAGGGTLAGLSPLAVLVPLLATALVSVAGRGRGPVATLATLGAGQLGLHVLLQILTPHDHAAGDAGTAAAPVVSAPVMVAAHAVATLLAAAAVVHADTAVAALRAVVRRTLPRRPRPVPVTVAPPARAVPDRSVPLGHPAPLTAHLRRGPPATG